jgi:C-terminal processing protease CtpA/Prc
VDKPIRHRRFPRGATRRIDDFGYLRLSQMTSNEKVLAELDDWMAKFRDTRGLILDIRGNLGGTKSILHTLYPYFVKPGAPMRLIEMTTYRLPRPLPQPNPAGFAGSLTSGQTVGSPFWKTAGEREQVAGFIRDFRPQWNPPAGKFSEWHVLGLDARDNPQAYYYDQPLIILQDSGTFSAGDIFVGAFEDHPNATQMGMPTGGGNSLMESYRLPNTGVLLVIGWSAKFRPNGQLYDGVGIPPDIHLAATPRDLLGETDTVLDAAVRRLKETTQARSTPAP